MALEAHDQPAHHAWIDHAAVRIYVSHAGRSVTNRRKLRAMRAVGVPYTPEQIESAEADARLQLAEVKTLLATEGVKVEGEPELLALISF